MIEEIAKTIRSQLYERVTSPLSGIFILSWALWNYEFTLVIISGMSPLEKISYIRHTLYPELWRSLGVGVLLPLLTTVALIFIYPIPAKYVYGYARNRQRELKEIRQKIDDETPLTREEARQIRKDALEVAAEYEKEMSRQVAEITRLKGELDNYRGQTESSVSTQPALNGIRRKNVPNKSSSGEPSLEVRPNKDRVSSLSDESRIIVTGPQLIDSQVSEYLQLNKAFEGKRFMVHTGDGKVVVTELPKDLAGKGISFEYLFDGSGATNPWKELERIKAMILKDLGRE